MTKKCPFSENGVTLTYFWVTYRQKCLFFLPKVLFFKRFQMLPLNNRLHSGTFMKISENRFLILNIFCSILTGQLNSTRKKIMTSFNIRWGVSVKGICLLIYIKTYYFKTNGLIFFWCYYLEIFTSIMLTVC